MSESKSRAASSIQTLRALCCTVQFEKWHRRVAREITKVSPVKSRARGACHLKLSHHRFIGGFDAEKSHDVF